MHGANFLDKVQQSMKGYKGRSGSENVASFDIVLNLRKRSGARLAAPSVLAAEEMEAYVIGSVEQYLSTLGSACEKERTLPFLYSHSVRSLMNAGWSISGLTMERLRIVLSDALEERSGRWFLPA